MNLRCWWFGCEQYDQDPSPVNEATCMHCGGYLEYSDMVGDTRHNRTKEWANYWLFRKWWPSKCRNCHRRFGHDESIDHLPF